MRSTIHVLLLALGSHPQRGVTAGAVSFAAAMLMCVLGPTADAARSTQTLPRPSVPLQPLAQQVRRLETALSYLGQPLADRDRQEIDQAIASLDEEDAVQRLQTTLDQHVLAFVEISAEGRVKVERGPAKPELVEGGTRLFLVKVFNQANVTAPLRVESPNTGNVYIRSNGSPEPKPELTQRDVRERWATISIYDRPPLRQRLSGLAVEYVLLEIFSRDSGQRAAEIAFNVGQGSQDIGFIIRDGVWMSRTGRFRASKCRRSTASAPTNTSSTSRIRARSISSPPWTRRRCRSSASGITR